MKFNYTSRFDTLISDAIYVDVTELLINLDPSIVFDVIYVFDKTPLKPEKFVIGVYHYKANVDVLYYKLYRLEPRVNKLLTFNNKLD